MASFKLLYLFQSIQVKKAAILKYGDEGQLFWFRQKAQLLPRYVTSEKILITFAPAEDQTSDPPHLKPTLFCITVKASL